MASNASRGNYYKRKTREYYEKLGYTVQLTEFMCATVIKGRCFYRKIDIFGSDGIAMNGEEIIFWNAKSTIQANKGISDMKKKGADEFKKFPFPATVKCQLVIWEPRKKPIIVNC